MLRQSVTSDAARNISAGPQLQASRPMTMIHSIQLRERRAREWLGIAISSAPACGGAVGRARTISDIGTGRGHRRAPRRVGARRLFLVRAGEAGGEVGNHLLYGRLVARLVGGDEGSDALLIGIALRGRLHRVDLGELFLELGDLGVLLGIGELVVRLYLCQRLVGFELADRDQLAVGR